MAKRITITRKEIPLQVGLGVAVKGLRLKLGVTQEELAWRAGMHRTYIADIERGGRNATLRSVSALARALNVSLLQLLTRACNADPQAMVTSPLIPEPPGEVLMVEDEATDAELTIKAFQRANFSNPVRVVRDGLEALDFLFHTGKYARRKPALPEVVLLDLNLPKMSGIEVLQRIKADPRTTNIPVVVLTISNSDLNIEQCRRLGAKAYIVKPVEFENFSQAMSEVNLNWALVKPVASRPPENNAA